MKKSMVWMLAAMASVCCIAGCGSTGKTAEPTTAVLQNAATVAEKETTAAEKETTTAAKETTTAAKETTTAAKETTTAAKETTTAAKETTAAEKETTVVQKENTAALADGTYSITAEADSSMFKITMAEITVENGAMTAVITLSGTGYGKLYMGTAEEAAAAEETACIPYVEAADGAYTYTIPVEALDKPIICAAYSSKKEQWYDRQITFLAASVSAGTPEEETTAAPAGEEAQSAASQVADGTYSIDVTLGGGSGKSTVLSPATITVAGERIVARIEWSSSNYDYMLVNGEKYLPVNTEGNSVFEIPVAGLDTELPVVGDTVAMSKPREIEYTLTFHSASIKAAE